MVGTLAGKVALISGGAGGVGRAAADLFASEGASVTVLDIQKTAGERAAQELSRSGTEALFVHADASLSAEVDEAVATTLARFGRIDVLFNHVGTIIVKPFLDTTEADLDRLLAVNVKSMVLVTKAVLPGMLAQGRGVIVNMASVSALLATPFEAIYCLSKAATLQFSRAIAVEYRDRGIRCNALCPGFIRTDHGMRELEALAALGSDVSEGAIAALQGRVCEPEEVARAALFLASENSSFVNGTALFVDNALSAST